MEQMIGGVATHGDNEVTKSINDKVTKSIDNEVLYEDNKIFASKNSVIWISYEST